MTETNQEIRQAARQANVFHYEIADRLHIQDSAFSRMLRKELPEEKIKKILSVTIINDFAFYRCTAQKAGPFLSIYRIIIVFLI